MILSAIAFCKMAACPSSEALLAYGSSALEAEQSVMVSAHLEACEFCGAELQMLTEHPPAEEEERPLAEMPWGLRQLAQTLLTADWLSLESLAESATEKERLTLTDA